MFALGFSGLLSRCRHCRRLLFALYAHYTSTFLRPFARWALPHVFARTDALTSARPVLRLRLQSERRPCNRQISLVHTAQPSMHSVTKHLTRPTIAFMLPAQRGGPPRTDFGPRSELRPGSGGSSLRAAESCSLSYGLHVRLGLLSTSPRGDAVTFGFQERASPGGGLSPP